MAKGFFGGCIVTIPKAKLGRIIRERRQGYKLWRIARDHGLSVSQVAQVLVKAGEMHWKIADVKANQPEELHS